MNTEEREHFRFDIETIGDSQERREYHRYGELLAVDLLTDVLLDAETEHPEANNAIEWIAERLEIVL